ncbi:putative disease resistance proteinisoform X2 [Iris pallida]|uniref:Disease resistance proteinisoform X2 n=1 Tax=Iris pallida TaxID=29817 RepID=A0AAX6GF64_IRIPA|nr:putative disease resistance proteinisoform X2 [Iris pallida]
MEHPLLPTSPKDPIPIPYLRRRTQTQTHRIPSKNSNIKKTHRPRQLTRTGNLHEAISAIESGSAVQPGDYLSLLQSCIDADSIDHGRRLHSSLGDSLADPDPFVATKLVSMYAKCGTLAEARQVFDAMPHRNLFAWSAMIGGCSREQRWEEVVGLFHRMMREGAASPDAFLLPKILQACANLADLATGRLLHSLAVRKGFLASAHVANSVLALYAKCGELALARRFFEKLDRRDPVSWNSIISGHCQAGENEEARRVFEEMVREGAEPSLVTWNILIGSYNQCGRPELAIELMEEMRRSGISPDVVTWTSMISGLAQNCRPGEAFDLFREMLLSEVKPNGMTVAAVVSASADARSLKRGKELHSYAARTGCLASVLVGNSLVDMYAKCGRLEDAQRVFDGIAEKDVFTWNSMIGGYALAGYCGRAHELFSEMESFGVRRNAVTWNVMISGHIQNGDEDRAMDLFRRMEEEGVRRNTASWNTLIAGSLQNGLVDRGLRIFRQMQADSVRPNSVTVLSVLPVCANLVSASKVKEVHASTLRSGLRSAAPVANALIDAYSNSGDLGSARALFDGLRSRDPASWASMISGCVLHGRSRLALDMFSRMEEEGVEPNHSVFASAIGAYALEGMVEEGKKLFDSMVEEHRLSPGMEHYRGMVELFGRAGRLREASELVETMPVDPDSTVWSALFTAARVHGDVETASFAAENLFRLDPEDTTLQRLTSSLQVMSGAAKSGGDSSKMRKPNRGGSHGCCWIEVGNKVHTFSNGERPTDDNMEAKLAEINGMEEKIRRRSTSVREGSAIDVEEEEVAGVHSEKLAMAFGLINMSGARSVRVLKSVRMCRDCHAVAESVSEAYGCDVLIKDPERLHHFRGGECSCRGYW